MGSPCEYSQPLYQMAKKIRNRFWGELFLGGLGLFFQAGTEVLFPAGVDKSDAFISAPLNQSPDANRKKRSLLILRMSLCAALASALLLSGCDAVEGAVDGLGGGDGETGGPEFVAQPMALSPSNIVDLGEGGYAIDTSTVQDGYVSAAAISSTRLKFQVNVGDQDYNYDLPNDGTPVICPLNMGDGTYTFTIWQNTSENRYVELSSPPAVVDVVLSSEYTPFVRPSFFCSYNESSSCVQKANELSADAANQGDVVRNIFNWITDNIEYDTQKAATVEDGYVPNPDSTLQSGNGICFDYASLAAAMLRSQGIPCKIMTGYVSPDNIYHAWNMVYIDGTWKSVALNIEANTWTRIDTTFAAGGANNSYVGDGTTYTDRYTY